MVDLVNGFTRRADGVYGLRRKVCFAKEMDADDDIRPRISQGR